jgi:serine protease
MVKAEYAATKDRASRFAAERDTSLHRLDPRGLALFKFQLDGASPAGGTGAKEGDPSGKRAMKRATLEKVRELNSDPAVAYAEPNFIAHPTIAPGDTHFGLMWNLQNINAPAAWDVTTGDTQTIIAIVDTGILYDHPDLEEKILKDGGTIVGYDMIHDTYVSKDGDGLDPDPYDVGDKDTGEIRSSFHGTHVAGIAAAASDNGIGIAGVSWQAKIMPVRVLGRGGGYFYDIAQGIYYAAGLPNDSGTLPMIGDTVRPAHIINLSLGDASPSQFVQDAVLAARNQGVIVVAAAGNETTSAPFYPAASFGVVAVSATDLNGDLSYYSNYGSYIDLAAPGGDTNVDLDGDGNEDGVLSTRADDGSTSIEMGYSFEHGTSMATPHVSGVAALMKSVFESGAPGLTLTPQIFDLLIEGTLESDTIGSITNYAKGFREPELGYGQIDALKAVSVSWDLSQSTELQAPRLALEPDELNFGFDSTQLACMVANFGLTPLAGVTVDPSYKAAAPWLDHDLQDPFITFTVDRSMVPDGPYTASVTVNSDNGGSETAAVTMYKSPPFQSDAGTIYVVLTDPAAGNTPVALYMATAYAANGYSYSIKGVLPGTYLLSAGTDMDFDDFLGDNGELLGRYPSLGRSTGIVVSPGVIIKNHDFSLSFIGLPVPAGGVFAKNPVYDIR